MHNPRYELSRTHFCSTLAIWPRSKPYRLGALLRPLGLFAGRSGRPTRKKSPYITRTCRALVWKALLSEKSSVRRGQSEALLIKVARGQAPLSSLLVYWGEGHIYRFCSKWLKSS
jgi:hypothetical protein